MASRRGFRFRLPPLHRPWAAAVLLIGLAVGACAQEATGPGQVRLQRVGGNGQTALAGVPLPESLSVRLVDANGEPLAGRSIRWTAPGPDSLSSPWVTTDRNGVARVLWFLGDEPGPSVVRASAGQDTIRFTATATEASAGTRYTGRRGYITYDAGALPIIISAPHGGTVEPDEIPDRTGGTLVRDANTDLLARALADALANRLGARPHLIIDHLHRRKMDANRAIEEATAGDPLAEHAWHEFQRFIDHAGRQVAVRHGAGLYIDLHGHGHDLLRLELGYLLTGDQLGLPDAALAGLADASSIRRLAGVSAASFVELVRGGTSLGAMFEARGIPAVPSLAQPHPGVDPFFSGGYNTRRHGSRDGGVIDGIQIEAHRVGLRDTQENRERFAGIAAAVLQEYLATHYGFVP